MGEVRDQVDALEAALREAMLASDVAALDRLLADDVLYTGPDGARLDKAGDLATHASGRLAVDALDVIDTQVRVVDAVAVVLVHARLAGRFDGAAFGGTYAYTRVWDMARGEVTAAACVAVAG